MKRLDRNIKATDVNNKNVISISGWDRAIKEARAALADLHLRKARLKAAIRVFVENKRNGVIFEEAGTKQ